MPITEDLQIGSVFTYYGPRRLPLLKRGIAVGRVVGLDSAAGVVHVQTYLPTEGDEHPEVAVGHLPILASQLERSIQSLHGVQVFDPNSTTSVMAWRQRYGRGEVGAFNVSLWEAESLAWEATPGKSPDRTWLEYAFPKRGAGGKLSIVEVACVPREQSAVQQGLQLTTDS